jgi:LysR family transcriptional regulator, nitrogen assimilation regulatory protein
LEIRQIRYFVAIYEAGSVTKASARLLIAQSALSQQLAQLEDALGVQLFTRSPQGVSPTAFGQMFYDHSIEILHRLSDAVESVRQLGQNPRGAVTLGMPESISIVLGLPLLQGVKERFPDVSLRLTEDVSGNLKERLKEGRLDLAIVFDDGIGEGLSAEPLVTERLYLISRAPAGAAAPTDAVTLSHALASPLVLYDPRDGLRIIVESAARKAQLAVSNLVAEVSSLTVIKNAVFQGVGATILPISCVSAEVQQGVLQAQEITNPDVRCTVVLCTRKDALLALVAASVFRLTVATVKQLCTDRQWIGGAIAPETKPARG